MKNSYAYQSGFGNTFTSEAEKGAVPVDQNNPQKAPLGLYAEQLSGSTFTALPHENKRTWLYKILPTVAHKPFVLSSDFEWDLKPASNPTPNQLRWSPLEIPKKKTSFWESVKPILTNAMPEDKRGLAIYLYACTHSEDEAYFFNSDAEMLFIPQEGPVEFWTELGKLSVSPTEIAVIPRGMKFKVVAEKARGYFAENYGSLLRLPHLGLMGANALANPRHFLTPEASYETDVKSCTVYNKFCNNLWKTELKYSPLNVVGWWGNYVPYKYDLKLFNTINTVSFDHPDPSIFTVLTSPSTTPGLADVDFVIFPSKWMVAEKTFRPPYFHRNIMSEYMGLIEGAYDAKANDFVPGGGSLHNCMSGHGPDANTFEKASNAELKPTYQANTLAFMLESAHVYKPTSFAMGKILQKDYFECWQGMKTHFKK